MNFISSFLKIVLKLIILLILMMVTFLDSGIAKRIFSKRYTYRDAIPHLVVLALWATLYYAYTQKLVSVDVFKVNMLLPTIIGFQGVMFAVTLTVSTFILTIFRPNDLIKRHVQKENLILDIVDDLRIANRIVFFSTLYIFIVWLFIGIEYLWNSIPLSISIFVFLAWSILGINSIIRGVFLLVKVD